MPAPTNHDLRDALAAGYAELGLLLGRYRRRIFEDIKAIAQLEIDEAARTGTPVDGTAIGRKAAEVAIGKYLAAEIHEPIEGAVAGDAAELNAGPDS